MRSSNEGVTVAFLTPTSLNHLHLAVVLASECRSRPSGPKMRVLDAGCGDGRQLACLHAVLPELAGRLDWGISGFDAVDSTSSRDSFPTAQSNFSPGSSQTRSGMNGSVPVLTMIRGRSSTRTSTPPSPTRYLTTFRTSVRSSTNSTKSRPPMGSKLPPVPPLATVRSRAPSSGRSQRR